MSPAASALATLPRAQEADPAAAARAVIRAAVRAFAPGKLALVSAFGPASLVTLHMMAEQGLRVPVIFVDTLHHFPETLALVEEVSTRYRLDLRVYRPAASRAEFEARYGERLWERDVERYQQLSKVEPFRRATAELDGWITGRRREQADTRAHLGVVELGEKVKVNPLADWTLSQVWSYLVENEVPYNPLHDRGYASIGDEPLTTPVLPGEHERAGRWRGTGKTECGIHLI